MSSLEVIVRALHLVYLFQLGFSLCFFSLIFLPFINRSSIVCFYSLQLTFFLLLLNTYVLPSQSPNFIIDSFFLFFSLFISYLQRVPTHFTCLLPKRFLYFSSPFEKIHNHILSLLLLSSTITHFICLLSFHFFFMFSQQISLFFFYI
jgi:hypothetical protein